MENYFYAQLDEQNICVGVSSLNGEMAQDIMIRIDSMNNELLGMKYERSTNSWEMVEPLPTEPINPSTFPPTKADIKELNELITENTIELQYLTSLTELGL